MLFLISTALLISNVLSLTCDNGYALSINGGQRTTLALTLPCSSSQTSCGIVNQTYSYNWAYNSLSGSYQQEYDVFGCTNSSICSQYAGGSNTCTKIDYNYYTWNPTGLCTNGKADGYNQTWQYTVYYACCQTSQCITNYDYSQCNDNSNLQNYVSALNKCWNADYQIFVDEMYCQHRSAYDFSVNCTSNGTWNSNSASISSSCYYQVTCSNDLLDILQDLADCGCQATVDYNQNNDELEAYLTKYYSSWCANVKVQCNGNQASLLVTYYYVKWSFILDVDYDVVYNNATQQTFIKADISTQAKVDQSTITLQLSSSNNRRLQSGSSSTQVYVTITTQDSNSAYVVTNNVNSHSTSSYGGYAASSSTSATTTTETENYSSSGSNMLSVNMIFVAIVFIFYGLF